MLFFVSPPGHSRHAMESLPSTATLDDCQVDFQWRREPIKGDRRQDRKTKPSPKRAAILASLRGAARCPGKKGPRFFIDRIKKLILPRGCPLDQAFKERLRRKKNEQMRFAKVMASGAAVSKAEAKDTARCPEAPPIYLALRPVLQARWQWARARVS